MHYSLVIKLVTSLKIKTMKRLFFSAAIVFVFTSSITSCKKDYNCECRDGSTIETTTYPKTGLVDARNACKDRQSFWQNTTHPAAQCTIL
jgi:hypothetical protein